MMNISVILSFLLCWSFVSPNPHHEKSNDKSVGESNHINDGSDTLTLGKEYSDEPSSGKDWGGDFFNFLNFFNHKDLDNDGKIYQADNKSFLDKLIYQGSNFFKTLIPKSKSSDNSLFDNIITWVQKNVETVGKLFTNKDNNLTNDSEIEESASIDEKIEKHSDRAKRDLRTSNSGLLWANPHKGGISEHLLKLSEGSSNVLKSEKATVAESLNGRAAISKILARAKAKAAKAAQYKNLYDNDDFRKWLLSGSSFDTNIFKHPFRLSHNTKITDDSETENTDNQHIFSKSHHVSKPTNHEHHREIKHTLPNSTALGIADTDRSYTKLSRKSEHQKHLSSKLQSTSGEKHGRDTNEMLHKPTVSRHTHGLSSYEDEEDTGLRHTSSHADAPHVHFRITKDQETGNNIPKRKHAKWTHTDSSRAHASHASHSAESYEFETSDERERYGRKFIFKTSYKPGEDEERIYTGHRKGHKFSEEINIHEGDKTNYDHLASSLFQHGSSIDPHHEKNIKNRNKQNLDGIQYSTIHSTTSTETKEGIEKKQSGNMLITKISTGVSTRHTKPVNIDIEHYHSRDQGVAANSATSFSSSLSDNKENKRTNNVLASPSVDDGSATVGTKTENDYGALGRTHSVIDNDVTSTGIEMGFSGIESHPPVDSSLAHSSLSHVHSKTHLGNQKVHHSISGYERSTVASETKHLMDAKTPMESQNKDHDLKANKKITTNVASSTETIPSITNEHHHRIVSSDEEISDEEVSDEENYMKARKKYMDLKGKYINHARHKTSIEVIDIDDDSAEVLIPEFPVHKHGKAHVLHDINYYDFDGEEISDEKIESAEDLKRIQNNYDNLEEKEKFTDNTKVSKESQMIISNERLSHDRHSQHRKNDKHNQHKYRSHHNKQNRHKNNNQYNHHSTYNQHKYHSQDNHHVLDEQANNMKSSSTASDATEFDTWDKYIYFIQKHGRRNTESNASFESSIKEGKKQNNAKHEKILLLNKKGRKYISDEDKHHYLKKHTNLSGPVMHSIEINKITSTNNNEKEIKSENNTKNRSKVVTRVESLIPDGSTIDTSHMKHNNKKISNNNKNYSQASWELMSLKNSRADVQTETEGVDDTYGGNENVDIKTKQTAKAESKSNIQSASSKTSESDNTKKIVAMIEQASDKKISSSSITSGYQNYDNEISGSSKLTAKSQMDTIRHSNKKLENTQEINANVGTLTKLTSLNDKIDKSRSNIQNAIASSKSSTKSQIGFWDYWNNKKYNTNAKASADAISVGVKNKQKSVLGNTSTFSKLSANSEESKKYSNDLKNAIGTAKSEALSGAAKASAESMLLNVVKDKYQSQLQKSISSSSVLSSEKSQAEYERNNLQKNKIDVSTAKVPIQSTAFNNNDKGHWSDSSKSSLPSKWLKEKHIKNKHYSDNIKVNHEDNVSVATEIGETSSDIVRNSHQQESKNVMKNSLSETSSDLFSKAQVKSAHDSVILKDDCKNSATANTIIKTKSNNYGNQHEDLHKTRFLSSSAEDSQHNIKSILSENSYVTIPAINENIVKSGKAKKDGEVIFNLSTLGKMKIHNKIKKEHLNNWPITTSDIATLAEERTENKDKFNDSKTTEKVAVYTGTSGVAAATNNIESEQHDIHVEDRNKLEDSWNTETKIRNAILDTSAEMIALKEKNKSERKSIFDNKLATALSNEAQTKTQIINKGKYGVMDNLESSVNTEETQHSITSAMSSASASSSSNMNTDLGTKYDQINNKMSTTSLITSVSKDIKGSEKDLSSDQTSLHLADKINRCKKDVETREFISQATNLYKVNKS
ncbi:hypothetical protein RF55_3682 [Lasius niger]|uniref:Uncharacterized protein n=1 Tax=Lasius niger TaxID=67767 RepID=A0A0J7KZW8_LASNI|nr:hypothetical protein RF55_3682 [Lasius niger]